MGHMATCTKGDYVVREFDTGIRVAYRVEAEGIIQVGYFSQMRCVIVGKNKVYHDHYDYPHKNAIRMCFTDVDASRQTWETFGKYMPHKVLYRTQPSSQLEQFVIYTSPAVEAEYIREMGAMCNNGANLARQFNAPFHNVVRIKRPPKAD